MKSGVVSYILHCSPKPQEGALYKEAPGAPANQITGKGGTGFRPVKQKHNSGLKDEGEKLLLVNNSTAPLSKKYSLIYIPRVGIYTDMASVH
ncbi:hypothetical protein PBY51_010738 [Eleginops maclovinus]|uniref:Uncharacterized protein n=1 Tax=Eleginops maclovinus TaxID=56733 RepID=A0AAN7XBA0_ELEMC|nr:hypothetical protein PBY51_010738 [Eleginops maclovinus]